MPLFDFGNALPQTAPTRFDTGGLTAGVDALGSLASIGAEVASKVQENRTKLNTASLTNKAAEELENFAFGLRTDRDYSTQFERYTGFVEDLTKRYETQFEGDQNGITTFKSNLGQLAFKKGLEIRSQSLEGELDLQKAELDLNMSSLARLSATGDDEQKLEVMEKANGLLKQSYESGVITGQEAVTSHLKFKDDVNSAQIRYDILTNPDGAADKLLAGGYDVSSERSLVWLEKANSAIESRQRARFSEQDRTRRELERHEKEVSAKTTKEGDKLLFNGELTEEWVESKKDVLPDADVRYFYKALKTGDQGRTDPNIYSSLRFRASNGEDVRDEARTYLHKGMLVLQDYEKLVNRSEQNITVADVPNWFKRGEGFIAGSLRVSDINPDPAAAQRQANALDEWSQFALENPKASLEEARRAYQGIAKDYSLTDQAETLLLKPLPRFVVGNRSAIDIDATKADTAEAFERGDISQDDLNKQALLIRQWEEALSKKAEIDSGRERNNR